MKKVKEKTDERNSGQMIQIIGNFCRHLKNGFSAKSFPDMDYKIILEFADKFDNQNGTSTYRQMIEKAYRESRLYWEMLGMKATVQNEDENIKTQKQGKFNSSVWIFTMKTRFGWKDSEPEPESLFPEDMVVRLTTNS